MLVIKEVKQIRQLFTPEQLAGYSDSDIEQILNYWNKRNTDYYFDSTFILNWKKFYNYIDAVRELENLPLEEEIYSKAEGLEPAKKILDKEGYIYMTTDTGDLLVLT